MSIVPVSKRILGNGYPTTDGKPMAETDLHRDLMFDLIKTLSAFYAQDPQVYVSGNLLLFYEENNRRRHVSPDVFVVFGVEKGRRDNYLLWEEKQSPRVVIELTSGSTRKEDQETKFALYRDVLKVTEYFLFDPRGDYLQPTMQGWRLRRGVYQPIKAVDGHLPSHQLKLHLERDGEMLRLWNPATKSYLPTPEEATEQAEQRAEDAQQRAMEEAKTRKRSEAENARLRRLLKEAGIHPDDIP